MASAEHGPGPAETLFTAERMLGYLAELDAVLADEGVAEVLHLHVAGGAVIATKTDARLTSDVDVVSEAMTEQLRRAVAVVSERHPGLRRDGLNDGAKLQRVNLPMEPERIYTGSCLVVESAGDRYVLAMKLASGRPIDEADCELLIRSLAIRDESELLDLLEQAIPDHLTSPAMAYFAAERLRDAYPAQRRRRRMRIRRPK